MSYQDLDILVIYLQCHTTATTTITVPTLTQMVVVVVRAVVRVANVIVVGVLCLSVFLVVESGV